MAHLPASSGRVATLADRAIAVQQSGPQEVEPDFLEGLDVIDLTTQLDAVTGLSPLTVLVILELDSDYSGSTPVYPTSLACHCLRCYERHLACPDLPPQTPLGIHLLFETLGRRSPLWEWDRAEFVGRTRRVVLCDHSLGHRVWISHRRRRSDSESKVDGHRFHAHADLVIKGVTK